MTIRQPIIGKAGEVYVGATPTLVGMLTGADYAATLAQRTFSIMGEPLDGISYGGVTTTGTLSGYFFFGDGSDPAPDAGQLLLATGTELEIRLRPNGTGSGKPEGVGLGAVITGENLTVTADADWTFTIPFWLPGQFDWSTAQT